MSTTLDMSSIAGAPPRSTARRAGLFWLMTFLTGAAALAIGGRLIVSGDAAKTAASLLANESAFRWGVASASQMVKMMGNDMPKLGVLFSNAAHGVSHYGNMVIYLRLKNVVPPSSEPGFNKEMRDSK
jgi:hypothetical protein